MTLTPVQRSAPRLVRHDHGGALAPAQGTRGGGRGRGAIGAHFERGGVDLVAVEFDGEHVVTGFFRRVFQFVSVVFRLFYFALLNDAR